MDVVIASDKYEDELFADISYRDSYWARVIYDSEEEAFSLIIYTGMASIANPEGDYVLNLSEVQAALEKAKARLTEIGYGREK